MEKLRVSLLQMNLAWENPAANRATAERLLSTQSGATDLVILPEMFTTGFTMAPTPHAEDMSGESVLWMQEVARRQEALVMGSMVIKERDLRFNRFLVVGPEGVVSHYDKRHTFRMAGEHKHYQAGNKRVIFSYKGWRILPQVCYDLRFPVWARTQSDDKGPDYDLLIYVANWPEARTRHWETLLEARAIENQTFVIGVNRVGKDENDFSYIGSSVALDPHGKRLAWRAGEEALLQATLDPEVVTSWRKKFPVWQDADSFEL